MPKPVQVPPPDPNSPEGMAFVYSAGFIDPRGANYPRQPLMLIQGWAAQSSLLWDLGLRFHPELATKHLKGGGQFSVAEILEGPPPPPDAPMTVEDAAQMIMKIVGEKDPAFAATIERLQKEGNEQERAQKLQELGRSIANVEEIKPE